MYLGNGVYLLVEAEPDGISILHCNVNLLR